MTKKFLISIIFFLFIFSACTENQRAKKYGGKADITLSPNKKLINVTWKDDHLWYLVRNMTPSDSAETYQFQEKSSYGIWEGTFTIIEVKQ